MVKFKLKSWHTYYAVLKFKHLSFYRSKEKNSNSLRGNIVLKDCTVGNSKIKKNCIAISVEGKVYYIAASNESEKNEWMEAIMNCVENEPQEEFDEEIVMEVEDKRDKEE